MGIHEREYVRQASRGGGGGPMRGPVRSMRMWSVTTWLIVICVAVFVIDGFLPTQVVNMGIREINGSVDPAAVVEGPPVVEIVTPGGQPASGVRPLYIPGNEGVAVGFRDVRFMPPIEAAMHFSTVRGFFQIHFWRLVGFQFLHDHQTVAHLLFNMIGLFFFGPMVERYLGSKRYLAFYLLCGHCGALMYVLLNLGGFVATEVFKMPDAIPGLIFNDINTPLIGASAGVFGIIMAGAYLAPNATVLLFFVIPMRLRTMAYGLVILALFTIIRSGHNAGGEAGHLGGALAGFYFIRRPQHLHGFFDFIGWVDPTSHHYRHQRPQGSRTAVGAAAREEVDRILDKVHTQGLASLTARERRILQKASERE